APRPPRGARPAARGAPGAPGRPAARPAGLRHPSPRGGRRYRPGRCRRIASVLKAVTATVLRASPHHPHPEDAMSTRRTLIAALTTVAIAVPAAPADAQH